MLEIEIAYANALRYQVVSLQVPVGTTLEQAIVLSGILQEFPEINLSHQSVGIFGQIKEKQEHVQAGDRVEIYRPLHQDPMQARKVRVKQLRAQAKDR